MKKSVLSTAIAGALLAASWMAIAQMQFPPSGPSPNLTLPEKGAFSCIEQSLSLVAALIDRQGCAATEGNYTLSGDIDYNGDGSCTIDDTTVDVRTLDDTLRGTHQVTAIAVPGEIDDVDFIGLDGEFWYSGEGEILWANANFLLCLVNCGSGFPGAENYDEHVIKDFDLGLFASPGAQNDVEIPLFDRVVFDQGLEVITKNDWPRKKYRQQSEYVPPNGGIGRIGIRKVSIAPSNAPQCYMLYRGLADDFGGGIQFSGDLNVMPLGSE